MNIAVSLNEKFSRYGYVTLLSLFRQHATEEIKVYVLCRALSEKRKAEYMELASEYENKEILFFEVSEETFPSTFPHTDKWPMEVYFRLLLPFLLPDEERVLYLDTDIIVREPIDELYSFPFDDCLLWGAVDNDNDYLKEKQLKLFGKIKESYPSFHYINSGVLLMNLKGFRESYRLENIQDIVNELADSLYAFDQDIINYMFYDQIGYFVGERYNFFARLYHNSGYTYDRVVDNKVAIIHYSGAKPWSGENLLTDLDSFWWDVAKKTPYYYEFLEERVYREMEVGIENLHEVRSEIIKRELVTDELIKTKDTLKQYQRMLEDCRGLLQKISEQ